MASGNKTTQTSTNTPNPAVQPILNQGMGDALSLYQNGGLVQPNTMSSVVPFSTQTMQGMQGLQNNANAMRGDLNTSYRNLMSTMGRDGLAQAQRGAMNALKPFTSGANAVDTSKINAYQRIALNNPGIAGYRAFVNGGGDIGSSVQSGLVGQSMANPALSGFQDMTGAPRMSMSETNLSDIASGGMLNREDPNFERVLGRATDSAAQQVNSLASSMGRFGSGGAHQGTLARTIGDLQADARLGQYNTERQNQVQANQLIDAQRAQGDQTRLSALSGLAGTYGQGVNSALNAANSASQIQAGNQDRRMQGVAGQAGTYAQGVGQALGAAQAAAGIQGQNRDRQLSAIGSQFNAGQQQVNNLSSLPGVQQDYYSGMNAPYDSYMDIGSMYEGLYGNMLNDRLGIGSQMQNNPYNNLQALLGLAGAGSPYSSQTQTAQGPSNTLSNILGGGLGLASLLKGF